MLGRWKRCTKGCTPPAGEERRGKDVGEGDNLGLLRFLAPSDVPRRILTVEGLEYLPALRLLYPAAELHAVAAERTAH